MLRSTAFRPIISANRRFNSTYLNPLKNSNKPRIVLAGPTDTRLLLSIGSYLFETSAFPTHFIARALPSVVIGKHQNPYLECNLKNIKRDNVPIIRRETGGGAVYVDEGTLMVGFYGNSAFPGYNKDNINRIILSSLNSTLPQSAEIVGKNDIKVSINDAYYKIAGQAFRISKNSYLHHLSILMNTDMSKLANYLTPNKLKIMSKGTSSVNSHVKNMLGLINNPDLDCDELALYLTNNLAKNFIKQYDYQEYEKIVIIPENLTSEYPFQLLDKNSETITDKQVLEIEEIKQYYDNLCDSEWTYRSSPEFTHLFEGRYNWGIVRIELYVKKGVIEDVVCYTDSIHMEIPDILRQLTKTFYDKENISSDINLIKSSQEDYMKNILADIEHLFLANMV